MVSPPATKSTSFQEMPASAMASRAAFTPYSTKLRPHLPQGCIPTPRIATSLLIVLSSDRRLHGAPLPNDDALLFGLEERVEHELHLHPDLEARVVVGLRHHAEHDHLLGLELHRRDGEGLVLLRRQDV